MRNIYSPGYNLIYLKMHCSTRPTKYCSNKINIYNNNAFIVLPYLKTSPPPPSIYIAPTIIYPSGSPCVPPTWAPAPVPINYPGACGSTPYNLR